MGTILNLNDLENERYVPPSDDKSFKYVVSILLRRVSLSHYLIGDNNLREEELYILTNMSKKVPFSKILIVTMILWTLLLWTYFLRCRSKVRIYPM